jgi:hypothetical protein
MHHRDRRLQACGPGRSMIAMPALLITQVALEPPADIPLHP